MVTAAAHNLCKVIAHAEMARLIPLIHDPGASPVKAEIMSQMLPAVHLIAVVSALDHGLEEFLDENDVPWPPKTRTNLFNRIELTAQHRPALNAGHLHEVRGWRNDVGHMTPSTILSAFTWEMLAIAIERSLEAFIVMDLLSTKPTFERRYQRDPQYFLDALGPRGERVRHSHRCQVLMDGQPILEFTSEQSFGPAS